MRSRLFVTAAACTLAITPAYATTCSCASVPLLGTMELASPAEKQWYLASTYEYHDLSKLVRGSSTVPDDTARDRTSQALILEASRGLTEKWAISALVSVVHHERIVSGPKDEATGLGDAVVMVKYLPTTISLYSRNTLSFGLGARLPVGESEATNAGIVLAEDLQPSTGAYATILWLYAAHALNESRSTRIYASSSYTKNEENDRNYQFGHETTVSLGAAHRTQSRWAYNFELLYRSTTRDRRESVDIPNTGGTWLDLVPAVQYHVSDKMALRLSAKIPLSRNLNDQLQFTTKYAARLTFSYVFGNQ